MKTRHLLLDRIAKRPTYTIGKLFIDGEYFCDTLEDTVREMHDLNGDGDTKDPGEGKVYGQTAITPGTYRILMYDSPHFGRQLPWLQNVPSHDYVLMHVGCWPKDTLGCILVGKNKVVGGLLESRKAEDALVARIKEYISQGYEVYITIK
jgi:hypothetical protein